MLVERIFGSKAKLSLFRAFYNFPKREFSLGELQKILNRSTGTIYPPLEELMKLRVVLARKAGRSMLYKLNYQNKLVQKMGEIFRTERDLFRSAANQFSKQLNKRRIISIILFGSVARNEAVESSDIDVLIIYKVSLQSVKQQVDKLANYFLEQDIIISPLFYSKKEIQKMQQEFNSFIIRVEEEGKVLYGKSLKEIC